MELAGISTELGTAFGVGILYVVTEVGKWIKTRKPLRNMKDNVDSILTVTNEFNSKIETIEKDIKDVKKEVMFNGGTSMKDKLVDLINLNEARFHINQNMNPQPIYNTNKMGEWTFANYAVADLFGMHYTEMLGTNWLKAVGTNQHDREKIYNAWIESVKDGIPFSYEFDVTNQMTKEVFKCVSTARSQRNKDGDVILYLGTITKL